MSDFDVQIAARELTAAGRATILRLTDEWGHCGRGNNSAFWLRGSGLVEDRPTGRGRQYRLTQRGIAVQNHLRLQQ